MKLTDYHRRSLAFHARTNVAVTLGVAVGAAALTGALLVGDSMRGSLREAAIGRLGTVDYSVVTGRLFREQLSDDLAADTTASTAPTKVGPVLLLTGGATNPATQSRANQVNILGVDGRFWALRGAAGPVVPAKMPDRSVILNAPLAGELGVKVGDDVLVRLGKPATVATETLLGRRDDTTVSLRLQVTAVVAARDLGAFSLSPRQFLPKNAYVPLPTLQRAIGKLGRVNALLMAGPHDELSNPERIADAWQKRLDKHLTIRDFGLTIRVDAGRGYLSLESEAMLIEPAFERAARSVAAALGCSVSPIQVYLANRICKKSGGDAGLSPRPDFAGACHPAIPYSTVAALDPTSPIWTSFNFTGPTMPTPLKPGEIVLNDWAANDLGATPGDEITVTYYVTGPYGLLTEDTATFRLAGVVALAGAADDPGFTPPYKGVTDTRSLADWDPPFPMDLKLIRDKDETYWTEHHATPKAFLTLEDGKRLWAHDAERFGSLTAIRLTPRSGVSLEETAESFEQLLLGGIDPEGVGLAAINPKASGFSVDPVRSRLLAAASGPTDFGVLFVSFSFFLIASAAMLVALLFRLGVERRASEIGLLLATGFSPRRITRMLIVQGAAIAAVGTIVGLIGAIGYAYVCLAGLRSWWSDAVNTPFLRMHATTMTYSIGFVASVTVALLSIAWSIRGLTRRSARSLLASATGPSVVAGTAGRGRVRLTIAIGGFALAIVMTLLPFVTSAMPSTAAFFGAGSAMLIGGLGAFALQLHREHTGSIHQPGRSAWVTLGLRNARRNPGRSLLTAGLIASATFLIAALQAFHLDVGDVAGDRSSGTGGYRLFAESATPLLYDLNTKSGREKLNVSAETTLLDHITISPFRLRPGDASSCLNLYRPTKPRILGATEAMIQRGGFAFAATAAESPAEQENPWALLDKPLDGEAIPVIGDEAAVLWQLHLGLGKELTITDERGHRVVLRFVALLKGSMLQDELIVSAANFERLFPSIGGYGFFLIDAPAASAAGVERVLETELAPFSFDVGISANRLREYVAVQNTYLSTFQTLGGFGLILGTIGLAAVMLRNVWERRGELALLRALGFSRVSLGWIVLSENVGLLIAGLTTGVASAMLAIAPYVVARPQGVPWLSLSVTLLGVFTVGIAAGLIAIVPTLRAPLLGALRSE